MPTSIAHALGGLAAAEGCSLRERWSTWRLALFCAVVANLPDLDFLPGILAGDPTRYHREATHSLLAALLVGLAAGALAAWRGRSPRPYAALAFLVYLSHLALDAVATGPVALAAGVPFFWPLLPDKFFTLVPLPHPLALLLELDLDKTDPRGFAAALLSTHAALVFLGHALLFLPLPILARLLRRVGAPRLRRRLEGYLRRPAAPADAAGDAAD